MFLQRLPVNVDYRNVGVYRYQCRQIQNVKNKADILNDESSIDNPVLVSIRNNNNNNNNDIIINYTICTNSCRNKTTQWFFLFLIENQNSVACLVNFTFTTVNMFLMVVHVNDAYDFINITRRLTLYAKVTNHTETPNQKLRYNASVVEYVMTAFLTNHF